MKVTVFARVHRRSDDEFGLSSDLRWAEIEPFEVHPGLSQAQIDQRMGSFEDQDESSPDDPDDPLTNEVTYFDLEIPEDLLRLLERVR